MAKSRQHKSKNSQNHRKMKKSGGHSGGSGYNEGINRKHLSGDQ